MKIKYIFPYQILDSRGNPTVKVELFLDDGSRGSFEVPSGASTGIHEALELRDNEKEYLGKSVHKAINNIKKIREKIYEKDFTQESLDKFLIELDGTENKSNLGANAILGISIAFAKASAKYYNLPLYDYLNKLAYKKNFKEEKIKPNKTYIYSNVINGGLHSGNKLNVQEFLIIANLEDTLSNIRATSEIYHHLKKIISETYGKSETGVGDEGGFAPSISKVEEALDLITKAIDVAGYTGKVGLGIDSAASDFYIKEKNLYEVEDGKRLNYKELTEFYNNLIRKYHLISIEDPFGEDDFEAWHYFMKNIEKPTTTNFITGKKEIVIIGDDILVTNPKRIKKAQKEKLCNSLLLKVNQIGTLTESFEAFNLETIDSLIADLAVALNSPVKTGAPARGERIAKYNRLIEINIKGKYK